MPNYDDLSSPQVFPPGPNVGLPQQPSHGVSEDLDIYDPSECQIRVSRLEPVYHKGHGGWYKTYEGKELGNLETRIKNDFGAGRYRIDIVADNAVVDQRDVEIAGDISKDSSGNVIAELGRPSADAQFHKTRFGISLDEPSHDYSQQKTLYDRVAILQEATRTAQDELKTAKSEFSLREKELNSKIDSQMIELSELKVKIVRLEADKENLSNLLDRERQHAQDRIQSAQQNASNPMMTMLMKHVLDSTKQPTAPAAAPVDPIEAARSALALAREVDEIKGHSGGGEGSGLSGMLGEIKGLAELWLSQQNAVPPPLTHNPSAQQTNGAQTQNAAQPEQLVLPAAPNAPGYATEGLRIHLQNGLQNLPDPATWALESMQHITVSGRRDLAAVSGSLEQQIAALEKWIEKAIPAIKPSKLRDILESDEAIGSWFFKSIQFLKGYASHAS